MLQLRWRIFASILLPILMLNTAFLFASSNPIENKSLNLFASHWGTKPDVFEELPPQHREGLNETLRFASKNDGIVIPDTLEEWAKTELGNDTNKEIVVRVGEDEYYTMRLRVIPQFLTNSSAVNLAWISLFLTLICSIAFAVLLITEKPTQP